jgi:RNA polymerase sigma-70 factor (ECF subfamily)
MTPAALGRSGRGGPGSGERHDEESASLLPIASPRVPAADERLRGMLSQHFDFIWRSLRRFGLTDDRADDAAQQVFMIASRKLDSIQPDSERSFLFGTAMRVASDIRRSAANRREIPHADPGADLEGGPRPDDLLDQRRARMLLDAALDAMELDLRSVFVLFELEEMTTSEIAVLLAIPPGTAASRLRRAREEFQIKLEKLKRSWGPTQQHGHREGGGS